MAWHAYCTSINRFEARNAPTCIKPQQVSPVIEAWVRCETSDAEYMVLLRKRKTTYTAQRSARCTAQSRTCQVSCPACGSSFCATPWGIHTNKWPTAKLIGTCLHCDAYANTSVAGARGRQSKDAFPAPNPTAACLVSPPKITNPYSLKQRHAVATAHGGKLFITQNPQRASNDPVQQQ
jgi:hypothetical protein